MATMWEALRDVKRGAVGVLAAAVVLAVAGPALAAPEDSITPIEQYKTPKSRALASTYKPQLVQFYEHVYWCLPWLGVMKNGIGFRQPKDVSADDRYLSVWVAIDQTDDGSFATMSRDRRVSAMFSRYGVDLLRRMTAMTTAASDADLTGFSVVLTWPKPGQPAETAGERDHGALRRQDQPRRVPRQAHGHAGVRQPGEDLGVRRQGSR